MYHTRITMKTRKELAKQAFEECCSPQTAVKHGKKNKFPFWNAESLQFMYAPAFHFTAIKGCEKYRFDAVDENNVKYSFETEDCCDLLTPIWAELPEGVVQLTVTALNKDGSDYSIIGARTFFKSASFPEQTPKAVCSYIDCAKKAYEFAINQEFVQHFLKYGTPDPHYDLNVYPAKMISSLGEAMILYAQLCDDIKDTALKIAVNAAEFLLSITPRGDKPLADLPPTYYLDFCPDADEYGINTPNWRSAVQKQKNTMMIYPAFVGMMYLHLGNATKNEKYIKEAVKIADYYKNTVEKNGSWYLLRSVETGEPIAENFISPMEQVVPFLMEMYEETKDDGYRTVCDKAVSYAVETQMKSYNWEGQFEDILPTSNYMNLTHYSPIAIARYYSKYHNDSAEYMEIAKELMRFAEDQFVVWNRPSPWNLTWYAEWETDWDNNVNEVTEVPKWITPCALEQYNWHVPIDASTANFVFGFLSLYEAGCGDIYLAKAKALADQITRSQHENGMIPTHWPLSKHAEDNLWFNCLFFSCAALEEVSKYEDIVFDE